MQGRHRDGNLLRRATRHSAVPLNDTPQPGTLKAQRMTMTDGNLPAPEPAARISRSRLLLAGLVIGLSTGLGWSTVLEMSSGDNEVDFTEFLISLAVPVVVAIVAWRVIRTGIGFAVAVAFLTLVIPLFGIGMGGADILQMTIGGSIGGVFWSLPFVAWRTLMKRGRGVEQVSSDAEVPGPASVEIESADGEVS